MADPCLGRLRNNRPVDDNFEDAEKLYYRVLPAHADGGGLIDPHAIRCPDSSCDREKYFVAPQCVIANYPGWLVAEGTVESARVVKYIQEMPQKPRKEPIPPQTWTLEIHHVPEDENYSHSELWLFRQSGSAAKERQRKDANSSSVSLAIRAKMVAALRIVFPDTQEPESASA